MTRVTSSAKLKSLFRPDCKSGKVMNHIRVEAYACNTIIEFDARGAHHRSQKWFINDDNELIYNISKNLFINLDMFDDGTSIMENLVVHDEWREADPQIALF